MRIGYRNTKHFFANLLLFGAILVLAIAQPKSPLSYSVVVICGGLVYFGISIANYLNNHSNVALCDALFGFGFALIGLSSVLTQNARIIFSHIAVVTAGIALGWAANSVIPYERNSNTMNRSLLKTSLLVIGLLIGSFVIVILAYLLMRLSAY